jgi:hypothetical protein
MLKVGGEAISWDSFLATYGICTSLSMCGSSALRCAGLQFKNNGLMINFLVGLVIVSIGVTVGSLTFDLSSLNVYLILLIPISILYFLKSRKELFNIHIEWADTGASFFFALLIGFLIIIPASAYVILVRDGYLPLWIDYYIHGTTIASFGSPYALGGSMEVVGIERNFYHYAPFAFSAIIQTITGNNGLIIASTILLPLGLLVAAYGLYAFANSLMDKAEAALSVFLLICIPFNTAFIQSAWFDLFWIIFSSPGTGYGIGISAISLLFIKFYFEGGSKRALAVGIVLLFSIILFRVHIFLLLFPPTLILILIHQKYKKILIGLFILFILTLVCTVLFDSIYLVWLKVSNPFEGFNLIMPWQSIYGYQFSLPHSIGIKTFSQLLIVIVAVLGVFIVAYPILFFMQYKRAGVITIDYFPVLLLINFIGLQLFAPVAPWGDMTEYKHRHFPFLYIVFGIFTFSYLFKLFYKKNSCHNKEISSIFLIITIGLVVTQYDVNGNPARPNIELMPWSAAFYNRKIEPGAIEVGQYLKTHSKKGDSFLLLGGEISGISNLSLEIIAMSGVPSYITRPEILEIKNNYAIRDRREVLKKIESSISWLEVKALMRLNNIKWCIVWNKADIPWAKISDNYVYKSDAIKIFDSNE